MQLFPGILTAEVISAMNSLTPFIHHAMEDQPGTAGTPGAASSRISPPLGIQPPGDPSSPGAQVPPPDLPGQTPHPTPDSAPSAQIPMTDGTPAACRQKNAQEFLKGSVPGVMAQYAPGLFSTEQHLHSAHPAPDEDTAAVQELVDWREDAPYG